MVCELIRPHSLHHSLEYFLVPVAFRLVVNEVEADLPIGQGDLALDVNGRTLLQHCRITFRALEVGAPVKSDRQGRDDVKRRRIVATGSAYTRTWPAFSPLPLLSF